MSILVCKACSFILETRPGRTDADGVCMPCINNKRKNDQF